MKETIPCAHCTVPIYPVVEYENLATDGVMGEGVKRIVKTTWFHENRFLHCDAAMTKTAWPAGL